MCVHITLTGAWLSGHCPELAMPWVPAKQSIRSEAAAARSPILGILDRTSIDEASSVSRGTNVCSDPLIRRGSASGKSREMSVERPEFNPYYR